MSYYDEMRKVKRALYQLFDSVRTNNVVLKEKDVIAETLYHYTVSEKAIKRLIEQAYNFDKTMHREEGDIWFGDERNDSVPGK